MKVEILEEMSNSQKKRQIVFDLNLIYKCMKLSFMLNLINLGNTNLNLLNQRWDKIADLKSKNITNKYCLF